MRVSFISKLGATLAISALAWSEPGLIEQRQGVFEELEKRLGRLEAQDDWRSAPDRWTDMADSVRAMKQLYPQGSREGSRSRRSVWSKRSDFMGRLDTLARDLDRMGEASVLGRPARFEEYLDEVDSSCLGCHMRYKSLF